MIDFEALNNKLLEAESVISSKYHFRFPDLNTEDIEAAEIMMCVLQSRVITEGICRFIVLQHHLVKDEKSIRTATLKVYVDDLLRPNLLIPKSIISNLSTIQGKSNLAVHFQTDGYLSTQDAYICLVSLEQVLTWFVKTYGATALAGKNWKISTDILNRSGKVPPKADGCVISREKEVKELRSILQEKKVAILHGNAGVGKTELAKDYMCAYQKKYAGSYYAENVEEIIDYVYNLPIGILDENEKNKEVVVEEKLEAIHSMGLVYLFVIDNYSGGADELKKLYPLDEDKYHLMVLVSDESDMMLDDTCYEVKCFMPEDSLKIFRHFCQEKYTDEDVYPLLKMLDYNPRAMKMSALFLDDNDLFTPESLMKGMKKNTSIKSILQNLYIILTEVSILGSDELLRILAECLSLIPYNGVSQERFFELFKGIKDLPYEEREIKDAWDKLVSAGWLSVDDRGCVLINPLISDTIFENTHPDMSSRYIVEFVFPILKPIKDIRDLYLPQVVALKPFVEHLTRRIEASVACDIDILNELREYYIAVYDVEKVDRLTERMENEFEQYTTNRSRNTVENAIFRLGISRFNLEDFENAHESFSRALDMLDLKMKQNMADIAKICAYEASSLATMGRGQDAIDCIKRSIAIREELRSLGNLEEAKKLWISYYNYAKVLLEIGKYLDADAQCNEALEKYAECYPNEYSKRQGTNFSSLLQLQGRICARLGKFEDAIDLLEEAKTIREKLKGENFFSTAQIYAYLMEVYDAAGKPGKALAYAEMYHDVLRLQYKSDDIKKKLEDVCGKIENYKEKMYDV